MFTFVQVLREELLREKYIEVKKSIRGDPTKAESFPILHPLSWIHESRTIHIHGKVRNSNTPIGMSRTSLRQPPNMLLACVQCPRSIEGCGNRICLDRAFREFGADLFNAAGSLAQLCEGDYPRR